MRPPAVAALLCLVLAGCAFPGAPPEPTQAFDVPAAWSRAGPGAGEATLEQDWWLRFEDPVLAGLVERALQANMTVRGAQAALREARLAIAQDNLAIQQETLQITQWRRQAGLVTALEEEQARASVAQTGAQLPALETAIAQARQSRLSDEAARKLVREIDLVEARYR
jgi:outer membrane protein TolC